MNIQGYKTETVEIDVKPIEVYNELYNHVLKQIGLPIDSTIEDGIWVRTVNAATSHSFEYQDKIRKATQLEEDLLTSFNHIKQYVK